MLDDLALRQGEQSLKKGALGLEEGQASLEDLRERTRRLKLQPATEEEALREKINALRNVFKQAGYGEISEDDIRKLEGLPLSGGSQQEIRRNIEDGLGRLDPQMRAMVEPAIRSYMQTGQYEKALQVYTQVAEKAESGVPEVLKEGDVPYGLKIRNRLLMPGSPEWTPEHQAILDKATQASLEYERRKNALEDKREAAALARLMKGLEAREMQNLFTDYDKAHKSLVPLDRLTEVAEKAQSYVDSPTGPGDVALLSNFVEATKPERGFRWTQQEVNLITQSRGWVEGAQARIQSGYTGTLFGPPGSEQRKIIGGMVKRAGEMAADDRRRYMQGIKKANPKLYDLFTDDLGSDFKPEP